MAQITLTAGANPAFLSKNYVNRDSNVAGDLVVSSSDLLKHRLYDNDFTAIWASSGSDDTVTETITVGLYEGSLQTSRSIDFFALMAVNLKNFIIEYSADNGLAWTTVSGANYAVATADFAGTNLILSLSSPITANKLRVTMYRTQSANQEKQIGGFIAALGTFQTVMGMTLYDPTRNEMRKVVEMADGSKSYGSIYRSDNSFEFYSAKVGWRFVTTAYRTLLREVKNSVQPVLWYPEPGDAVQEIFLVMVKAGSFKDPYSTTYKGAGYDIELELDEVGGG